MKRSPLSRKTPLRPGKPLRRGGRLRPINHARRARLSEAQYGHLTGKRAWIAAQPCCCGCGSPPPSECAHVRSKNAGGLSDSLIPLAWECHRRAHQKGWSALGAPIAHWRMLAEVYEARWNDQVRAAA